MSELSRITLADIGLVGHHGYHDAERELGQRFEIDVDLWLDISKPGESDKLTDAVNYENVYLLIERIVRNDRYALLEALSTDIADSIYDEFDVEGLSLRIRKPAIPHCPNLAYVEIEVERGNVG